MIDGEKIKGYLESHLLIQFGADAQPETNLFESGFLDSMAYLQLVGFLEREHKIRFSNSELISDALSSLSKILETIESKTKGTA